MSETLIPAEAASPPPGPATEPAVRLANEERIKNEEHPLDCYHRLVENARNNHPPSKADTFRFKWSGWFYLSPVQDAFMARLRIPGPHGGRIDHGLRSDHHPRESPASDDRAERHPGVSPPPSALYSP